MRPSQCTRQELGLLRFAKAYQFRSLRIQYEPATELLSSYLDNLIGRWCSFITQQALLILIEEV